MKKPVIGPIAFLVFSAFSLRAQEKPLEMKMDFEQ